MVVTKIRGVLTTVTAAAVVLAASPAFAQSAELRHVRNGGRNNPVTPGNWVNGSLNASQAHYLEGYSVPYRALITGLSTGAGNPHSLIIEWDTTKSGKHALDFITHYNRIEPHAVVFGHAAELIDPLEGLNPADFTLSPPVPADIIPAPSSAGSPVPNEPTNTFNALPVDERRITIYNGTITGLSYVSESSPGASDGSSSLKIDFIANSSSVLILWGGHIASSETWGEGNSAAQIPGASYHTRLISLDGASTGNQDRSLSAMAVFIPPPPPCDIDGLASVCPGTTNAYQAPFVENAVYAWTITSNCGATFVGGDTVANTQTVEVVACATCGSYTLDLTITADNQNTPCQKVVAVADNVAPTITGSIETTNAQCFGNLPAPAATIAELLQLMNPGATITDNCTATNNLTVTSSDGALNGSQCNGSRVRTYMVTDICGNTSTVTHTFTFQDTTAPVITGSISPSNVECNQLPPPVTTIQGLLGLMGGGSITDNCPGTLTLSSSDGPLNGSECNGTRVRTYTVTDACGNSATITHTFNIHDTIPPVINGSIPSKQLECDGIGTLPPPATTIGQLLALMNDGATIGDNCTATINLVVNHVDLPPQGSGCDGSLTRRYTVKDACGNGTTVDHNFSISDEDPPVITAPPTAHIECGNSFPPKADSLASLQAQGGDASDDCALQSVEWVSDELISQTADCPILYKRTYRAADACGNTALSEQLIVLQDSTPPVICCTPALIEGCLEFPVQLQVPIVTDECGMTITPVPVRSDGLSIADPYPLGDTTITWTAQDGCGNVADPMVVTVRIKQCPVFTTKTQAQWSNAAGGGNDGSLVQTLLTGPNGGPLIVGRNSGDNPRSFSVGQGAAACLGTRLPASGTATTLPANLGNKALKPETCQTNNPALPLTNSGKFKNSLVGQTIALMLNSRYNKFLTGTTEFNALKLCPVMTTIDANGTVKSYVIPAAVLDKLGPNPTVAKLRDLGRDALAGVNVAPATPANINTAISRVNQMFSSNLGHVALLKTSCFQSMAESSYNPLLFGDDDDNNAAPGSDVVFGDTATPNALRTPSSNATVTSGVLAPGEGSGVLKIEGDFVQEPDATLVIQLRGCEPVTEYDQVLVNGNAFLHGMLVVNVADEFTPPVGQQFEIISAETINGEFDAVHVPPVGGLSYLDVQYTPAQVVVEVRTLAKPGDFDENGSVDAADLLSLLNQWNAANSPADLDGDGTVNAADLVILLGNWGSYAQLTQQ